MAMVLDKIATFASFVSLFTPRNVLPCKKTKDINDDDNINDNYNNNTIIIIILTIIIINVIIVKSITPSLVP